MFSSVAQCFRKALAMPRSWIRFLGIAHAQKQMYSIMPCKALWI